MPKLPPGPKRAASLLTLQRDPNLMLKLVQTYGDIVRFRLAGQEAYLLNHPDYARDVFITHHASFTKGRALQKTKALLGEGLLTSEGELHLRQRRLMQPVFHRQHIANFGAAMVAYADRACQRWHDGEVVDIAQAMMRLTLAIVGKTLFDADVEGEATEVGGVLTDLFEQFPLLLLPFSDFFQKLPVGPGRKFRRGRAVLDGIIHRMIADRRAAPQPLSPQPEKQDLLSMLLRARDEDGSQMTDTQVRDEALTIFLAGHETTANALTWTWFLLSQHPRVEAKFHAELDRVLGQRLPRVEDVEKLKYTRMILSESMRLYPPAWIIGRLAIQDVPVGEYILPARSTMILSPWVMHHDARYYPDPFRFDPERWTPEAQAARPKFAYFPFGGGPRLCIGEPFAWMEGILLLATIGQQWWMRLAPGQRVELMPAITLRPKYGMRMRLERR